MKIQVIDCEEKVSAKNVLYKKATLKEETGKTVVNVAVFSTFPQYAEVQPGAEVEGIIKSKIYNGALSYSLESPIRTVAPRPKPSEIKAAQERKIEGIKQSQENKDLGIKISSTIRMAVDIVNAHPVEGSTAEDIETSIRTWRQWLWLEWEKDDKDFPPF